MPKSNVRPDPTDGKGTLVRNYHIPAIGMHSKGFTVFKIQYTAFDLKQQEHCSTVHWKRFSEFVKLHKDLQLLHKNLFLKGKFPDFAEPKYLGRFDPKVLEERTDAILELLKFISLHSQLYNSQIFVSFFQTGYLEKDLKQITERNHIEPKGFQAKTDFAPCLVPERVFFSKMNAAGRSGYVSINMDSDYPDSHGHPDPGNLSQLGGDISDQIDKATEQQELDAPMVYKIHDETPNLDDFADYCVLPTSISCSELREEQDDLQLDQRFRSLSRTSKKFFSLSNFFPSFSKRTEKAPERVGSSHSVLSKSSYLCQAAGHFAVAQDHESVSEYLNAINAYKEGIQILLDGVKHETDKSRRASVRKKVEKYINRAEELSKMGTISDICDFQIVPPFEDDHSYHQVDYSDMSELLDYRVIGTISSCLMLVKNMKSHMPYEQSVVKVLPKSQYILEQNKPDKIFKGLPFFCNLMKVFNAPDSVILFMEYFEAKPLLSFLNSLELGDQKEAFVVNSNDPQEVSVHSRNNEAAWLCVKRWAAELVVALQALHSCGIHYGDLHVGNVLLRKTGHIALTFTCFLHDVDQLIQTTDTTAPEVRSSANRLRWKTHPSSDWWSFGAIMFLLLVGNDVDHYHPEGLYPNTVIRIPDCDTSGRRLTSHAKSFLSELLQVDPMHRLGYFGADEVKSHPYFEDVDWESLTDNS